MAVQDLAPVIGLVAACAALAVPRATLYRNRSRQVGCALPRPTPARALSPDERQAVLDVANSDRFVDVAPEEIVATLLDEGLYHCSPRTMYRILADAGEVRERRNQLKHPEYKKPELLATAPNQVWSWDITKLLGPEKWTYFYLYVVLDVYSRKTVGWLLAGRENASLAKRLISETCKKEGVEEGQLTIHSDRGAPMTSKTLAQLMADLVVTQSHSRPHVSDDNPFSESQFKTLKYQPDFPDRFQNFVEAHRHCRAFFDWYNNHHRHSGIAFLTPADVHGGRAPQVVAARQATLTAAFEAHPERFVRHPPQAATLPPAVWINQPPPDQAQAYLSSSQKEEVLAEPHAQVADETRVPLGVQSPLPITLEVAQAHVHVDLPASLTRAGDSGPAPGALTLIALWAALLAPWTTQPDVSPAARTAFMAQAASSGGATPQGSAVPTLGRGEFRLVRSTARSGSPLFAQPSLEVGGGALTRTADNTRPETFQALATRGLLTPAPHRTGSACCTTVWPSHLRYDTAARQDANVSPVSQVVLHSTATTLRHPGGVSTLSQPNLHHEEDPVQVASQLAPPRQANPGICDPLVGTGGASVIS